MKSMFDLLRIRNLLLGYILSSSTIRAQEYFQVVSPTNIVHDFTLLNHEIKFVDNDEIEIHSVETGVLTRYAFEEVHEIHFSELSTSMNLSFVFNQSLSCSVNDDALSILGIDKNQVANIRIFNLAGSIVYNAIQPLYLPIPLKTFSKGIYLLLINDECVKFKK